MTVYKLPTSKARGYRGKYPNRIREMSYSPSYRDAAGKRAIYVETNSGDRITISLTALADTSGTYMGKDLNDIIKPNCLIHTLDKPAYDAWLSEILDARKGI